MIIYRQDFWVFERGRSFPLEYRKGEEWEFGWWHHDLGMEVDVSVKKVF